MSLTKHASIEVPSAVQKSPTGIQGLDDVLSGGLPRGRPTLVCGSAGCGKTLLATEYLVRGATRFDEPGVMVTFDESPDELVVNVASLGFDLEELRRRRKLHIDHVRIDRSEVQEAGDWDLEGLFVRLDHAVKAVGARRVVLDTPETLFQALSEPTLRSEFKRLFRWLKDRDLTTIVTASEATGRSRATASRSTSPTASSSSTTGSTPSGRSAACGS